MGIRKDKRKLAGEKSKSSSGKALIVPTPANEPEIGKIDSAALSTGGTLGSTGVENGAYFTGKTGKGKRKVTEMHGDTAKTTFSKWWDVSVDIKASAVVQLSPEQSWYQALPAEFRSIDRLPAAMVREKSINPALRSKKALQAAYQKVVAVYDVESRRYQSLLAGSAESRSDRKWMQETIKSGTMSDKVAAMALQVQESPFHELGTLEMLVGIATKKQQRPVQLALVALKDLFINNLLPNRPLRDVMSNVADGSAEIDENMLRSHLLLHPQMTMRTALLLYFESRLKSLYSTVLYAIGESLQSSVDFFKRDCLGIASELLIAKPEREALVLETIVNKLGDPSKPTASKAVDVLKEVLRKHPAMKAVVVREVRQFIYRPNLKLRPIFTAILLLAHVPLNQPAQQQQKQKLTLKQRQQAAAAAAAQADSDSEVAASLVETYVSMFERAVREGEVGSRLLSALLSGINTALPHLRSVEALMPFVNPLFRLVHAANSFTTSTQALVLLSHLVVHAHKSGKKNKEIDAETSSFVRRFYRALYSKLLTDQVQSLILTLNALLTQLLQMVCQYDDTCC